MEGAARIPIREGRTVVTIVGALVVMCKVFCERNPRVVRLCVPGRKLSITSYIPAYPAVMSADTTTLLLLV